MTNWCPALDHRPGPRYVAIADALAADISEGRLPPGTRLPTHRDLAWDLKVTVGTVKTHVHNILGKLGVRRRTEAAARARELGLV